MRIFGNFGLNVTQMFPSFRWNIFSHVERLAQEHAGAELFDELDEQSYNLLFILELGITHMQCKARNRLRQNEGCENHVFNETSFRVCFYSPRILTFHFSFQVGQLFGKFRLHLRHRKRTVDEKEFMRIDRIYSK